MTVPIPAPTSPLGPATPRACGVARPAREANRRIGAGLVPRLASIIRLWRRRAQESRQLLALSDTDLRDTGLSRSDAWREASKPFWRG
jgi:uncharacterized protein YjiS (DUF1127 family)